MGRSLNKVALLFHDGGIRENNWQRLGSQDWKLGKPRTRLLILTCTGIRQLSNFSS